MKKSLIHLGLFLVTVISATLAGAEWMTGRSFLFTDNPLNINHFYQGFHYSIPFLGTLTFHEFGHYFLAKYHKIKVTLPYYLPMWMSGFLSIGTLGAFIKLQETPKSRIQYFDIGVAGPLAGFVTALVVLWYGFTHLPPVEHIYSIHPEYKAMGANYSQFAYKNLEGQIYISDNLLFAFFKKYVANQALLPNSFEIMHYPYLLAGYLALFFTSLNMLPIGQLDGGHIIYSMFGEKVHRLLSPIFLIAFIFYAGLGIFNLDDFKVNINEQIWPKLLPLAFYILFLKFSFSKLFPDTHYDWILALSVLIVQLFCTKLWPQFQGYSGFLVFGFLLGRVLGVYHPPVADNTPLDTKRMILGWISLLVFILCFSPKPIIIF